MAELRGSRCGEVPPSKAKCPLPASAVTAGARVAELMHHSQEEETQLLREPRHCLP